MKNSYRRPTKYTQKISQIGLAVSEDFLTDFKRQKTEEDLNSAGGFFIMLQTREFYILERAVIKCVNYDFVQKNHGGKQIREVCL